MYLFPFSDQSSEAAIKSSSISCRGRKEKQKEETVIKGIPVAFPCLSYSK
jgi:hypothetical protein